jgi:hypothetical protein
VNFWITAKTKFGEFFPFFPFFSKHGKQFAKVLETIKLNKKLMPRI